MHKEAVPARLIFTVDLEGQFTIGFWRFDRHFDDWNHHFDDSNQRFKN